MSYLADMHAHSIYSFDGQMKIEDAIKKAKDLNLKYLALTEHLEFEQIGLYQALKRYKIYSEEISCLQQKYKDIQLIKAVEFSNPEKHLKELEEFNKLDIDYILASNHILPKEYSINEIINYYKTLIEISKLEAIDCIAHLDYIRIKFDDSFINNEILEELFYNMKENNISLEINTSAKRRINEESFPNNKKLLLYKKYNNNVTFGSDAHRINDIYFNINDLSEKYNFKQGVYLKRKFKSI